MSESIIRCCNVPPWRSLSGQTSPETPVFVSGCLKLIPVTERWNPRLKQPAEASGMAPGGSTDLWMSLGAELSHVLMASGGDL